MASEHTLPRLSVVESSIGEGPFDFYIRAEGYGALGYAPKPDVHPDPYLRLTKEHAAFIVRACNNHSALVEALKAIERRLSAHPDDTAADDRRDKHKAHAVAVAALAAVEP